MIGIIVAGHGNFPTGIMSAVSLIAGNPEHIKAVDFVKGMSSQELFTQQWQVSVPQRQKRWTINSLKNSDSAAISPFGFSSCLAL